MAVATNGLGLSRGRKPSETLLQAAKHPLPYSTGETSITNGATIGNQESAMFFSPQIYLYMHGIQILDK